MTLYPLNLQSSTSSKGVAVHSLKYFFPPTSLVTVKPVFAIDAQVGKLNIAKQSSMDVHAGW